MYIVCNKCFKFFEKKFPTRVRVRRSASEKPQKPWLKFFNFLLCILSILNVSNYYLYQGASKKISKKKASEAMIEVLKQLPPVQSAASTPPCDIVSAKTKKKFGAKKKSRSLVKENGNTDYHTTVNPVSKLMQIQQSKKEKEPTYTVICEKGAPRRREFVVEVEVSPPFFFQFFSAIFLFFQLYSDVKVCCLYLLDFLYALDLFKLGFSFIFRLP